MKRNTGSERVFILAISAAFLFSVTVCGGGGGSSFIPIVPSGGTGAKVSGTAVKGPVSGGTVAAFGISNGARGNQLASAITDGQGNFSMTIGNYSGPLMLQMTGGRYTDEATGSSMTMGTNDLMTSLVPTISSGATLTGIQITPLTSMAQTMAADMAGGMTTTNVNSANDAVGGFFLVNDILHTPPMDPAVQNSGAAATQDMKNYGMAIAAMSESAKNLGMTHSSGMVTLMMNDASDGVMNGMMHGAPISMSGMGGMMGGGNMASNAGTSGLGSAMATFVTNTVVNRSGVTQGDMQTLINKLNASDGTIQ